MESVVQDSTYDPGAAPEVLAGAAIGAVAGGLAAAVRGGGAASAATAAAFGGLAGAGLGYVAYVRQKYRVSRTQFARLSGVSERTLGAWEREGPKHGSNLRTIQELDRLYEGLSRIVKPEFIGPWLETPNSAFEGFKPIEIIERGQSDRIWRMIFEMEMNTGF